ncbi:hypothetical protein [Shewanella baltica]|uniref:hypothetical protein n=1 Tax=Shewanella baltica TaxID=62322 RepID=UPI00217E6F46|nr:hypothetical protein [Shewanella baltica]
MSHQTVAIKIKTPSGDRYFYGFGKGKSVQSAWSLAGAKLFLIGSNSEAKLNEITEYLKAKKKRFEIVEVSETEQVKPSIISGLKLDLLSAYGDGWYDGFLAAQREVRRSGDLDGYEDDDVLELSEVAEEECQLIRDEKTITESTSQLTLSFIGRNQAKAARREEYRHIEALHECIANEDIEAAKRLMADFIDDQVPF